MVRFPDYLLHKEHIAQSRRQLFASAARDRSRRAVTNAGGVAIDAHDADHHADVRAGLAGNDAEAVMLDFVQPLAAGGQLIGFGWEARRDEARRKSTRTGKHDAGENRQRWPRLEGPSGGTASLAVGRRGCCAGRRTSAAWSDSLGRVVHRRCG